MNKIRLLLVDDHALVRAGLKAILDAQDDLEVIGEAGNISDALKIFAEKKPDVVVLDLNLPGGGSLPFSEKITSGTEGAKVMILSMHDEPAYVRAALAAGAKGYLVKTVRHNDLLAAVRAVHQGQVVLNLDDEAKTGAIFSGLAQSGGKGPASHQQRLSGREEAVLRLLGQGHSNQEVAETLELSPKTVATYRARIAEKLGLKTTAEYVKYVNDNGLTGPIDNLG